MNIEKMKTELFQYAVKVQKECLDHGSTGKYRTKYLIVNKIYREVLALKDEKSIRAYAQELFNMSKTIKAEYDKLYERYSNETKKEVKASLVKEVNDCAYKLNAYNETYNIINSYLPKIIATPKKRDLNPPKMETPVTKTVPLTRMETTPKKESMPTNSSLLNEDTILSDKIISLLERYNDLDKNSPEALKIQAQVYTLRLNRENKYRELYGNQYRIFISEIESFENMASMMPSEGFKPREVDSNNYILELRTAINAINEYHFMNELQIKKYYKKDNSVSEGINENKFFKKYNNFLRKFHVLIGSLFKSREVTFDVDGIEVSSEDLIAYLGTCNLDGDFSVYKRKFDGSLIGTEEANRKKYNETLLFLNKCINSLCELAKKKLSSGKINIVDKEMTKDDIIKKRNAKFNEIYYLKKSGRLDSGEGAYERR